MTRALAMSMALALQACSAGSLAATPPLAPSPAQLERAATSPVQGDVAGEVTSRATPRVSLAPDPTRRAAGTGPATSRPPHAQPLREPAPGEGTARPPAALRPSAGEGTAKPPAAPRPYAAPDRRAVAQAAIAESDEHPSPFRMGVETLWQWATGVFRREPEVTIAQRGPLPGDGGFWLGLNLPWIHYGGDFGANAWSPDGGIAAPANRAKLDAALARLESAGIRRVRWFLFCDGRAGLRFAADGTPTGIDEHVLPDLDAALEVARAHRIQVMFALVDFAFPQGESISGGVHMGGHADVLRDPAKRQAWLDTVVSPLMARYGQDRTVLAWDVINEPEWAVFGLGAWKPAQSVAAKELRAFVRETTARIHAEAVQPVTVGSASTRWLGLVEGLGLDFYQPHWYDHFERFAPLGKAVSAYKLDRPVMLGEFPTKGSKKAPDAILDAAAAAGYAGGFGWAMQSTDTATDYEAWELASMPWIQRNAGRLAN